MQQKDTDLIKTVRGLDQNGPGPDGEGLRHLWNCLTASADRQFHAAEEISLRWLLKSMNGASSAAELLRRYPLTWTILDCVFQRIPLFSLAKSLADRKFIAILQQTLKGVSSPNAGSRSPATSKRKRAAAVSFDLEALQSPAACLETAQGVFKSLNSLLGRLENPDPTITRDNIGAQHIRSLFCSPAAEAVAIVAPALTICSVLASSSGDHVEGAETWIQTISTIWNLHLQGGNDEIEVAIHLFRPSAIILGRIGSFPSDHGTELPEALKTQWSAHLESFMHQNLIIPGRAAFMTHRIFDPFTQALEISKSIAQLAAPALYFLTLSVSSELRKDNVEWLKRIFQAIEQTIRGRPDAAALMKTILELAIQRSNPVDMESLRHVCREYALGKAETDWQLIARLAACDPDIFQLSDDGVSLRKEVCDRAMAQEVQNANYEPIAKVIGAIMDGFRTRRSLTNFLQLWFEQLCEAERRQMDHRSPWFDVGRCTSPTQSLDDSLLETELSPSQLLDIIAWAGTQNPMKHPHSTCVFAATIAQAVRGEAFVDAVGSTLFDLVAPLDSSTEAAALKWRVVSSTMSWVAPDERVKIWTSVKVELSDILKTAPLLSNVTFEAFKCCFRAWDSLSLDDAHVGEPALNIENFTERLGAEKANRHILAGDMVSLMKTDLKAELQKSSAYRQYVAWYLQGSSRFSKLYYNRKGAMPPILSSVLSDHKGDAGESEALWLALLLNEINLNEPRIARDFINRLIATLESSKVKKGWPGAHSLLSIKILSSIPLEAFDRAQRERLMNATSKRRSKMVQSPEQVPLSSWKIVLGLATKLMGRPTFYEGMGFSDLVEIAEAMPRISFEPQSIETVGELIERFFLMASATIRQMAENIDERSIEYFRGASTFVYALKAQLPAQSEASAADQPMYMALLKALAAELARSPSWQNQQDMASLAIDSKSVLGSCVMDVMHKLLSEKKLLASPSTAADMSLFAAVDVAAQVGDLLGQRDFKPSAIQKLEKRSRRLMQQGDVRGWKLQIFIRTYLSVTVEVPPSTTYGSLDGLSGKLAQPLLRDLVKATTGSMSNDDRRKYLKELVDGFKNGSDTDGQVLAIQTVVDQLIDSVETHERNEGFNLAAAHSELTLLLLQKPAHARQICRIIRALLEKRPQAMGQWNVEVTLSTVCELCSTASGGSVISFTELCKLVEIIIKKHRLRLEGHYHILLSAMQALLCNLVVEQLPSKRSDKRSQVSAAHAYARLVKLICEPTAGAVSRSQLHSALDSATDAAKRSAGRHMYLMLMQYVKLQLEENVPRAAREALEPAMNSIFDITPPEGRKILNDAMDGSGRAILREMYKRYVKFGKWSGV